MLTQDQVNFYHEQGYLHLPGFIPAEQVAVLRRDLDWMIETWADKSSGWSGPWRQQYMNAEVEKKSMLVCMHDLYFYAASWMQLVTRPDLGQLLGQLVDGPVELHHSTMHVKPEETGHPFPMHQDWWFYQHQDNRYVDVLVHLDDTCHENGEIRFAAGSHKNGVIPHVTHWEGKECAPHLPTSEWKLEETVAVPAKAGDLVLFNIHTVHGSYINQTGKIRRMVRVGYRHPENLQTDGQSMGRPGVMVCGERKRRPGQSLFSLNGPAVNDTVAV
jgi:ectoine hydroxylase-related dioxygenase (phytanoyl-CoA dioxygenase family)